MHAAESRTITDRSHTQRSADSDPHPNHTMHAGSAAIRFGCAAAGRRSRQGRQGAAQPPAAHRRRFSAPLVGALFGDGLTVRYALQLSWCGSPGAPLRRPDHAHGRPPRRCCSSPSCCCDGYEWALAALAATQACSLVGPCMNGLCQRIHLAQVAAVGGCDGLVSALGLLILLLQLLLLQACSVAGAHWWYPPSLMTACLLLPAERNRGHHHRVQMIY